MNKTDVIAAAEPPLECAVRPGELLLEQARSVAAMDAMLSGLAKEYLTCLVQGRLDKWAAAAHAMIDLLTCDEKLPRAKRADMGPNVKLRGAPLLARPSRTPCWASLVQVYAFGSK